MVQSQAAERLHAACDECRTRKLKCSGDTPNCVRCNREGITCTYSPQKQMGRPRKRRRDGEAEDLSELPTEAQIERTNTLNGPPDMRNFPDFGMISPPHLHNTSHSNSAAGSHDVTPSQPSLGLPDAFGMSPISNLDFVLDPPIDPSLWDLPPAPSQPNVTEDSTNQQNSDSCTCLSLTYLTLTDLQSVPSFAFPQVVLPLRKAMGALSDLIHCSQCPKEVFTAIQNIQSVVSLFKAIIERFNKVLFEVNAEADRLEQTGQKKPYRVGDNNPALFHMHTGSWDCPMGFNIELEARDWQRIVKTALKAEVYGGASNPRSLMGLLKETEARQERWHRDREFWNEERRQMSGGRHKCANAKSCEALSADHIRRAIDNLDWE